MSDMETEKEFNERNLREQKITIEELANFCKSKGFVFRSSDIYGGFAGFWDFGPLGVELFKNLKKDWWNFFVHQREDMLGMDASIISHPTTWKASGHVDGFTDGTGDERLNRSQHFNVPVVMDETLSFFTATVGAVEDGQVGFFDVRSAFDGHGASNVLVGGVDVGFGKANFSEEIEAFVVVSVGFDFKTFKEVFAEGEFVESHFNAKGIFEFFFNADQVVFV